MKKIVFGVILGWTVTSISFYKYMEKSHPNDPLSRMYTHEKGAIRAIFSGDNFAFEMHLNEASAALDEFTKS